MKKSAILFIVVLTSISIQSQTITGPQLLEKAIQYHDPDGKWETFKGTFFITMKTPNKPKRDSEIKIDIPNQYFYVKAIQGKNVTEYTVHKGDCSITFNGDANPSEEIKKKHKLSCERANTYKNYYTYLYGMPMKLKDPGTIVDEQVNLDKFMGEMYLTLKVTYKKEVGEDIWYFYFNQENYALEAYQFYHDEEKNDGEYILFTGIETVNGIKMPKERAWYYNKNQQYLGTDILKKKL
tara:strand:+ start:3302 stop:4015 length:714 start_codon:yes stop_codon:yes gene_type:complete